ncbi:MAG: M20/M25/M40 family metallo-hydrolase [Anaerolineae bacterium]|nr:M20/M25/M40 family metallo-hydrolase [Thermoflexales bacterium]MDW8396608.1 M20/M25/M40 family metallo-hydrolase [Anaerolineae bacterium]
MHVTPPNWATLAEQAVMHLCNLIRLDTSNPPGNEAIAAEYVARLLTAHEITPVVIETAPQRSNVVARLKGDGSAAPLLLYFHTDVVPVERDKWTVDPFGGVVRDGYVYGRGAIDMKGIGAMQLAVFLEIANAVRQGKLTPRRDLILAATADEESDANQGIGVLAEKHPDLLQAEYALSEFGGFSAHINGKRFYPIQAAEKGNVWMRIIAHGQPGHASIPTPENAVVKLASALAKLAHARFPARVTQTAHAYLSTLADNIGGKQGVALRAWLDMDALREVPIQRVLGNSALAAELHAITHDTVTPTGLRAGYKTNVIPSEAEATLDCRTLPGTSADSMVKFIQQLLGEDHHSLKFVVDSSTSAVEFPTQTPLFKLIVHTLQRHDPAGIPTPYMMSGGTDAKHLARLGTTCYGFSPLQLSSNENIFELVHGHDERIPISALAWGVRVLYEVVASWICTP